MGRKRKRILIIGLPLFAKRVKEQLTAFDKLNSYKVLDTYYSQRDRLLIPILMRWCDVVYSINGAYGGSGTIDLAFKLKKKVVFHWVGTDVMKATARFKEGNHDSRYVRKASHLCEVNWIQDELAQIGIDAKILNFAAFDLTGTPSPLPEEFRVLTYLPKGRDEFFRFAEIREVMLDLPEVPFDIVGTDEDKGISNAHVHGWVNDMPSYFNQATICLRYTQHDGLSNFVLEGLSRGRYVIYNNPFPHVEYVQGKDEIVTVIKRLKDLHSKGELPLNIKGREFITSEFNADKINSELVAYLSA